MPTDTNKLLMQWQGPFEVVQKEGHLDFKINMSGKVKTFYANLLEMHFFQEVWHQWQVWCRMYFCSERLHDGRRRRRRWKSPYITAWTFSSTTLLPTEYIEHVEICPELHKSLRKNITSLLTEYQEMLKTQPGNSNRCRTNSWSRRDICKSVCLSKGYWQVPLTDMYELVFTRAKVFKPYVPVWFSLFLCCIHFRISWPNLIL